ncbi:MAG: hypothetical protein V3U92_16785 [Cellulophaga sp.]
MKKINKQNSFKTPEGYFEEFSSNLETKITAEESFPPKSGFNIPDNYFDNLNKELHKKIIKKETKIVSLHSYKKYYYLAASVAAVVLVLIGLQITTKENITFESIAYTDIDAYFETTDITLDSYEIAELFPMDDLEINDIITAELNEENIIQYLDANVEDMEDLNLEYDDE